MSRFSPFDFILIDCAYAVHSAIPRRTTTVTTQPSQHKTIEEADHNYLNPNSFTNKKPM